MADLLATGACTFVLVIALVQWRQVRVASSGLEDKTYLTLITRLILCGALGVAFGLATLLSQRPELRLASASWTCMLLCWWIWSSMTIADYKQRVGQDRLLRPGSHARRIVESARIMWLFGADNQSAPPFSAVAFVVVTILVMVISVMPPIVTPREPVEINVLGMTVTIVPQGKRKDPVRAPEERKCMGVEQTEHWLRGYFGDNVGGRAYAAWLPWRGGKTECVTGVEPTRVGPWWRVQLGESDGGGILVIRDRAAEVVVPGYVTLVDERLASLTNVSRRRSWGLGTTVTLFYDSGCSLLNRYQEEGRTDVLPPAVTNFVIRRAEQLNAFPRLMDIVRNAEGTMSYVVRMYAESKSGPTSVATVTIAYDESSGVARLGDVAVADDADPCPSLASLYKVAGALDQSVKKHTPRAATRSRQRADAASSRHSVRSARP